MLARDVREAATSAPIDTFSLDPPSSSRSAERGVLIMSKIWLINIFNHMTMQNFILNLNSYSHIKDRYFNESRTYNQNTSAQHIVLA